MDRLTTLQNEKNLLIMEMFTPNLSHSDFKVIKNMEVFLTTLSAEQKAQLPYDPDENHAEREAIREKIREIEAEITALDAAREE